MTTMHRIISGWTAVLVLAVASPATASAEGPSSGEVVRDWNDTARSQAFANPIALARILAIMHAAQHDAVNGAEPRYETYAATLRDRGADAEAAAAAAAHRVLVTFFPANQGALDERLAASLAAVPDGDAEDAGVALGRAVGDVVLAGARGRRIRDTGSVHAHARARRVGADPARVRADARTAVPERDAVHTP